MLAFLERGQHRIYCARLSNELCGVLGNNSLSLVRLAHSPSTGPDVACGHHQRPVCMALSTRYAFTQTLWNRCPYLIASVYGWLYWSKPTSSSDQGVIVRYSAPAEMLRWVLATATLAIAVPVLISRLHLLLPSVFPEATYFHI